MLLSPDELELIEFRLSCISPWPWWSGSFNSCRWLCFGPRPDGNGEFDGSGYSLYDGMAVPDNGYADSNGEFIANAPQAIAGLLEHIRHLESVIAAFHAASSNAPDTAPEAPSGDPSE